MPPQPTRADASDHAALNSQFQDSEEGGTPAIEPCEHMKENISALSDDTLRGPARWFASLHASYCPKCRPALKSLRHLRARLGRLRREDAARDMALTEERREAVQKAMEAADSPPSP